MTGSGCYSTAFTAWVASTQQVSTFNRTWQLSMLKPCCQAKTKKLELARWPLATTCVLYSRFVFIAEVILYQLQWKRLKARIMIVAFLHENGQ